MHAHTGARTELTKVVTKLSSLQAGLKKNKTIAKCYIIHHRHLPILTPGSSFFINTNNLSLSTLLQSFEQQIHKVYLQQCFQLENVHHKVITIKQKEPMLFLDLTQKWTNILPKCWP